MKGKKIAIIALGAVTIGVPIVLAGCNEADFSTEPSLDSHQVVTTESRQTVRETSLEWRERMKEAIPEPGHI